jgi:hypothetical protein
MTVIPLFKSDLLSKIIKAVGEGYTFQMSLINGNWEVEFTGPKDIKAFSPVDPMKALNRLFDLRDEING